MMKNKAKDNYLEKIPCHKEGLAWSKNENGEVTIEIENKGLFNRIFQLLLKKPKITYIHLEEMGSFIWPLIDGQTDIIKIGEKVKENFGEKAEPLYPRLVKYFEALQNCKFIYFK